MDQAEPHQEKTKPTKTESAPKPAADLSELRKEISIPKASKPLAGSKSVASKFNIHNKLNSEEKTETTETEVSNAPLPNQHFSQTDLETEWNKFLELLKVKNIVVYAAINGFVLTKTGENTIEIKYPSETAKDKFEAIQLEFFNAFKHKTKHFNISVEYTLDVSTKREIVSEKSTFEKFLEINPLLKNLDDLVKFDFS
ncbi:hypothetical protein [Bergeyella cardium]|uniref:hypothetical protein n=1 Tax=Bergeyella cardium TaxID=1585976 RepID=UPI000EA2A233|nr:hypothetical protein [Bergeyella cardium]